MALSAATIKTTIHTKLVAQFGAATDDVELQKFCDGMAQAICEVLTSQASVVVSGVQVGGSSAGGSIT